MDSASLVKLVEDIDRFKLMPESLISKRIFGVRLREERNVPLELPTQTGLHYFRLNRSENDRWEGIRNEATAAIHWPNVESSDFKLTLYMTVPPTDETK